jgi:TolA-binding protein
MRSDDLRKAASGSTLCPPKTAMRRISMKGVLILLALFLAAPAAGQLYTPPSAQDEEYERQRQQMIDNEAQMRALQQQQQQIDALRQENSRIQDELNRMQVEGTGRSLHPDQQ